jgi:brefeldin A-resistance guanine nucleotide exchange factor 1
MTHLQRLVLGPLVSVVEGGQRQIEELFSRVIFPMLDDLLKPTVYARDPAGMAETRLRASTFLCKAFMHFEVREGNQADMRVLWIQVLDLLDRLMHADRRDQMVC